MEAALPHFICRGIVCRSRKNIPMTLEILRENTDGGAKRLPMRTALYDTVLA